MPSADSEVSINAMITPCLIAGAAALLILWFWRWSTAPTPIRFTRPDAMARALYTIVIRGVHRPPIRGRLEVFVRGAPAPAIVFTKTKFADDEYSVVASINLDGLGTGSAERLREALRALRVSSSNGSESATVIDVEGRVDAGLALVLLQEISRASEGMRVESDCVGYLRDFVVSNNPSLTGIDIPDSEFWSRYK
jgi:hypothetical protein